ncbi:MAG TPA: sigma-70 family RNA polymerase sigma factor [Polyangia bacterium]
MATSDNGPTDAALVVQAQRGAGDALEILFRRHSPRVRLLALVLMGKDSDFEDLIQDSFVQAQRSLNNLKTPESFGRWLSAIVVGTAHKIFRRRRMMSRLGFLNQDSADLEHLPARTVSPEVAAQLKAACADIDRLQDDLRAVFLLRRVEGLRLSEIAVQLKVSLSTVKRRLDAAERGRDRAT